MTFYRSSLAKFLQFLGKRSNDSAAMAWAVEYNLNGTWDEPIDAFEAYLAMRALDPGLMVLLPHRATSKES